MPTIWPACSALMHTQPVQAAGQAELIIELRCLLCRAAELPAGPWTVHCNGRWLEVPLEWRNAALVHHDPRMLLGCPHTPEGGWDWVVSWLSTHLTLALRAWHTALGLSASSGWFGKAEGGHVHPDPASSFADGRMDGMVN